jgi:hypothetical protein
VLQLLVTADVVPSPLILFTLMMDAIRSSEMSILTRTTRHNIPQDDFRQGHHHRTLKSSTVVRLLIDTSDESGASVASFC